MHLRGVSINASIWLGPFWSTSLHYKCLCCMFWVISSACFLSAHIFGNRDVLWQVFLFVSYLVAMQAHHSKPLYNTNLFMQLANIMGRFQWLTCPRKVSISDEYYSLKKHICPSSDMLNFCDTIHAGFINWLASLWSWSVV